MAVRVVQVDKSSNYNGIGSQIFQLLLYFFHFFSRRHCMIKYDENSIFIIGGKQNDVISNKTWIINPKKEFQIKEGPNLNQLRFGHACGKMLAPNGKILLVVAGGTGLVKNSESHHLKFLNSVEILDPSLKQGWKLGQSILSKLQCWASHFTLNINCYYFYSLELFCLSTGLNFIYFPAK